MRMSAVLFRASRRTIYVLRVYVQRTVLLLERDAFSSTHAQTLAIAKAAVRS
jgi:hypothetical protein